MAGIVKAFSRKMFRRFAAAWLAFALVFTPCAAFANPVLLPVGSVQTWAESADGGVSPDVSVNVDSAEVLHHAHCACSASLVPNADSATVERPYEALTFASPGDDLLTPAAFKALFRPPRA